MSARDVLPVVRRRLLGVAFLAVIVTLVGLLVAVYRQAFTPVVLVSLHTDHTGNQLLPASDVKVRGLIVGEVRHISSQGDGADLQLALQPDKVALIPANTTARLLPKTLFGERYVSLELPRDPSPRHVAAGDVIAQDTSPDAVELEHVLADLLPMLQAVQPEKLATTLTVLSQALDGRGRPMGQTMVQLDGYLAQFNPQLPNLEADLKELAGFTDTYAQAAPDLLHALSDLTTTSRTIVEQRDNLSTLYANVTTGSDDLTAFLRANESNIIRLDDSSRPTLELLARYAPEYPCLLQQMAGFVPRIDQAFGMGTKEPGLHVTLKVAGDRGKYVPGEEPKYQDKRGPHCYPATPPAPQYPAGGPIRDGTRHPGTAGGPSLPAPPSGVGTSAPAAGAAAAGAAETADTTAPSLAGTGLGLPNSPAERDFLAALLAPALGVSPDQVPDWSSLLVGPLFRGAEVTLR